MSDIPYAGIEEQDYLEVLGARVHNLKNIDVSFPRNKLVVVTGLSGSGKSSLAFDTIYAEGQRRYMETFSAYSRQFIGSMERPDVDKINGLSPVIAIEQKTTGRNPRSTVGTITEIYDFLRLFYARIGEAFSYETGIKMIKMSEDQVIKQMFEHFRDQTVSILAPLVKGRKGHYRELFEQHRKKGYTKVRIDGEMEELVAGMKADRYKTHDIELVVDRVKINEKSRSRITQSVQKALQLANGIIKILDNETGTDKSYSKHLMDPETGLSYDEPQPNTFSFNSPYGACQECGGLGYVKNMDMSLLIPDMNQSLYNGAIEPVGTYKNNWTFRMLAAVCKNIGTTTKKPLSEFTDEQRHTLFYGFEDDTKIEVQYSEWSEKLYKLEYKGIINVLLEQYETGNKQYKNLDDYFSKSTCPECKGARLKKESLHFRVNKKNIHDLCTLDISELALWFDKVEATFNERQKLIATELLKEIKSRISFLLNVGLDYLNLDRPAGSLSGGESQRIRLATQIGSQLVNVLYILDEPSIGLHQRDNQRLIHALKDLRDIGNSVLVVEHDKDMILEADYVIDIGPAAGIHGGHIVAEGVPAVFTDFSTLTTDYIKGIRKIEVPKNRRKGNGNTLSLKGATGNNLKNVSVDFPLGKFLCVTGVSGSGKSTLISETLYPILNQHFYRSRKKPQDYKKVEGLEHVDKVIEIDQSPIGRTPRSNPATYTGVFTDIRKLYADLPEAKIRGYKIGRFSFNVKGGRCETCEGGGVKVIEMNFLPDVLVPCETCNSKRFNRETLEVRYKGKSISDVLKMSIEEAVEFFDTIPQIVRKIRTMNEVGLGYLTLGQSSTTLSGGEAQRVKLATELSKKDTGNTFYILDEPTTGLHFEDINVLVGVLNKLVDKGNTVLVIEHNMDVIKVADYVIDIGPEGGKGGGKVLVAGTPEEITKNKESYTGQFLKTELN
ncbi:MAG: excinuclease ABC subunit A [Sphingobacteriales bacterium]|jgi:excinuclease ABC subunit A